MIGIRVRKTQKPVYPEMEDAPVSPGPVQHVSYTGWYRSRADGNIRHHDEGDGDEREERHLTIGLAVGGEQDEGARVRLPFEIEGNRFVMEVPVKGKTTAGYATFRTARGHILYRVLSQGESPRALIDRFADFYEGLVPEDAIDPSPNDAATQIEDMNREDRYSLGYPDVHGEGSPKKTPHLRVGVSV